MSLELYVIGIREDLKDYCVILFVLKKKNTEVIYRIEKGTA